jgi:phage tail protein X
MHRSAPVTQQPAAVYVIRDGDDLTGIATRFYGNPAAAAVIWQANRGLLRDPGILPIGATILLPDPNLVAGLTQIGPRSPSIEPASGPPNVRAVGQTWP